MRKTAISRKEDLINVLDWCENVCMLIPDQCLLCEKLKPFGMKCPKLEEYETEKTP